MVESEDKVNQLDSYVRLHEEKTKKLRLNVDDMSKRMGNIEQEFFVAKETSIDKYQFKTQWEALHNELLEVREYMGIVKVDMSRIEHFIEYYEPLVIQKQIRKSLLSFLPVALRNKYEDHDMNEFDFLNSRILNAEVNSGLVEHSKKLFIEV